SRGSAPSRAFWRRSSRAGTPSTSRASTCASAAASPTRMTSRSASRRTIALPPPPQATPPPPPQEAPRHERATQGASQVDRSEGRLPALLLVLPRAVRALGLPVGQGPRSRHGLVQRGGARERRAARAQDRRAWAVVVFGAGQGGSPHRPAFRA